MTNFNNYRSRDNIMRSRKHNIFKSPDLNKLQEVFIDQKTKIYIERGADPDEARNRYSLHLGNYKKA